ncbi:response regulator transcription factor [Cytobacillus praedii]|uniref:Response regulator transcription factor n=1 Tax=Cytobacillus praedii TaxID=1742358 RepID=A0A4R1B0F0_9BACI|nr:response regulator transcription factor [Cytobacillus praedii]MED3550645.1 response regulator transcription factor [Cytobacillus praedii]TCJ03174.1 response regulator transcription factor [Cytobacillus praedii]
MEDGKLRGKTILLIEENEANRIELNWYLSKNGFEIIEAENGKAAKMKFLKYDPCFVLLETALPDMNGLELCTWIRNQNSNNVPIIIQSSKGADQDKIQGLKMGADDYIVKPFNLEELLIRIETVLRRTVNRCSKLSFKGLTIKPIKGIVKFHDQEIHVTHFEYRLLYLFMTHPDQILSREQIINELYKKNEKIINERTVDVHIKNLREKIAGFSDYPFIVSVRGLGYKFNIDF